MRLTSGQIRDLIARGETFRLECKKASGGLPSTLWPSYSAFSNSDGGVILLGVAEKDGTFEVCGVPDADKLIRDFWNAVNNSECVSYSVSNLFGVWEKMGERTPILAETSEPDRVELIVPIERISGSRRKSGQKLAGPKVGQTGPKLGQTGTEGGPNRGKDKMFMALNASTQLVYRALCEDVELTHRALAKKLDLSRTTIAKATSELVEMGFIRRMGSRRGSHWEVLKED